jgi:hypothetical protein
MLADRRKQPTERQFIGCPDWASAGERRSKRRCRFSLQIRKRAEVTGGWNLREGGGKSLADSAQLPW